MWGRIKPLLLNSPIQSPLYVYLSIPDKDSTNRTVPKSHQSPSSSPMSYSLPPEIFDLVINHLHDDPATLKSCCIISKSWVPQTRRHIFAHVEFNSSGPHVELWKKAFPDPSNSPTHHTCTISINGNLAIATADGWIHTFHNVEHLQLSCLNQASLIPFYRLSPAVRSLHLTYGPFKVFDLICSFPLLEDLALVALYPKSDADEWNIPLTSPKLTRHLELRTFGRTAHVTRGLLDLPGGLHFSKISAVFFHNDTESVTDLVSRCSNTLESLPLLYCPSSVFCSAFVTD